ncbi:MAG TPA: TonB family protein [Rhizomicrobium sp.]|jgi:TonB family protein|nr:TonB family protein [Rhizomicrobium sp.]
MRIPIIEIAKWLIALVLLWPSIACAQTVDRDHLQVGQTISFGRPHSCSGFYPPEARKANISGTAQIKFIIEADGSISHVVLSQPTGNADLNRATLACVQYWRYKPAVQNGVPIAVPWTAKVEWTSDGSEPQSRSCADFYKGPPADFSKIDGTTSLIVTTLDGAVSSAELSRSSGDGNLDMAAINCAETMHFNVKYVNKQPVDVHGTLNIDWKNLLSPAK